MRYKADHGRVEPTRIGEIVRCIERVQSGTNQIRRIPDVVQPSRCYNPIPLPDRHTRSQRLRTPSHAPHMSPATAKTPYQPLSQVTCRLGLTHWRIVPRRTRQRQPADPGSAWIHRPDSEG
jgi:hypothetical protein